MYSIKKYFNQSNSVAIDVGANIGNHSIFFKSFLADYLISAEPNPNILQTLERNLQKNIDNFSIYTDALGEKEGKGKLILPSQDENNIGMAKVSPDDGDSTINIITLDSMIDDWKDRHKVEGNISFIKIDVEGMELAVLKGAENIIEKHRPHLFLEAATAKEFR